MAVQVLVAVGYIVALTAWGCAIALAIWWVWAAPENPSDISEA